MSQDHASARRRVARPDDDVEELVDYCDRPTCRNEFRHRPGPGRRRAYCSEFCRRSAEKELRQVRSRLSHFEGVVQQLRIDVAAFGKAEDEAGLADDVVTAERNAEAALNRAEGALAFLADSTEPAAAELRRLYSAVEPVVRRG